jgi:hypothetical protein
MVVFVVVFSLLFVIAVAVIALPPTAATTVGFDKVAVRRHGARLVGAAGLGLVVFVMSGWLLPGLVIAIGASWAIGGWQRRQRSTDFEVVRLDALASWIENVRDVLLAGEQPVGAITSTVHACSPIIRPHVRRLAAGLGRQDSDVVFRRFADDFDDPLADLVAAGLSIAIRRGARTVPVLTALAEQTRQQVDRRRLVEAERAPTRREVHALTVIMGGLVIGLLVFGRSQYLDAYDEPGGQRFLAASLAGYVALIVRVQRLAAFPRPNRFLTSRSGWGEPPPFGLAGIGSGT